MGKIADAEHARFYSFALSMTAHLPAQDPMRAQATRSLLERLSLELEAAHENDESDALSAYGFGWPS